MKLVIYHSMVYASDARAHTHLYIISSIYFLPYKKTYNT